MIESAAQVSVKNSQLVILTDAEHHVAIEDITALLIENRQTTVTAAALSQLGQSGCAVFFCDDKHLPCSVMTPFNQHSRALSVLKSQISAGEPRKKRLWQEVVKAKVLNQAECLRLAGMPEKVGYLTELAKSVRSGDVGNAEATAAQYYFPALFGNSFTRADDKDGRNAGLNYGYAILRGYIARTLSAYGFIPSLGLHHRSTLNAFNLADDLIEPFRTVVDLVVFRNMGKDDDLTAANKRELFNCLNLEVLSGGQRHSVSYAVERAVMSLGRALNDKDTPMLLPRLLEMNMHRYE